MPKYIIFTPKVGGLAVSIVSGAGVCLRVGWVGGWWMQKQKSDTQFPSDYSVFRLPVYFLV